MTNDNERPPPTSDIAKAAALVVGAAVFGVLPVYLWSRASDDDPAGSVSSASTTTLVQREATTTSRTPTTTVSPPTTTISPPTTTIAEPQPAVVTTGPPPTDSDEPGFHRHHGHHRAGRRHRQPDDVAAKPAERCTTTQRHVTRISDESGRNAAAPRRDLRYGDRDDRRASAIAGGEGSSQRTRVGEQSVPRRRSDRQHGDQSRRADLGRCARHRTQLSSLSRRERGDPARSRRELDRVLTIMQALPNISVVVIGHADHAATTSRISPSPTSELGPSSTICSIWASPR